MHPIILTALISSAWGLMVYIGVRYQDWKDEQSIDNVEMFRIETK